MVGDGTDNFGQFHRLVSSCVNHKFSLKVKFSSPYAICGIIIGNVRGVQYLWSDFIINVKGYHDKSTELHY